MEDYIEKEASAVLSYHNLDSYEALWALDLPAVDEPNLERGGWSSVSYLELSGKSQNEQHCFFIKRQVNHLIRSPQFPLGEPTFARELRNIRLYETKVIPAMQAAYYAERKSRKRYTAILITHALQGYRSLDDVLECWQQTDENERQQILVVVGNIIGRLHKVRLTHRCLFPKHIFIGLDNEIPARFIDLEKSRYQWRPKRDSVADLCSLFRGGVWSDSEEKTILTSYMHENSIGLSLEDLHVRIDLRRKQKRRHHAV